MREWTIDSLFGRGGVHDSVIRVDTAYAEWQGARAAGGGTLGWRCAARRTDALRSRGRQPHRVRLAPAGRHPAEAGHVGRGAAARRPRDRRAWTWRAVSTRCRPTARVEVDGFEWQRIRSPRMTGTLTWLGGRRPRVTARAGCRHDPSRQWMLRRAAGAVDGFADSLAWSAGTELGDASRFDAAGRVVREGRRAASLGGLAARASSRCGRYRLRRAGRRGAGRLGAVGEPARR